jgi:DNA-binding transcriptional LysR family regulator
MFDIGHARSFVAVAEEMHFGRAAARLNLSQSPLSRQIQALERALGVTLLERTTRAVRLTPVGRTFLMEAYRVLAVVEGATQITRRAAEGENGLVRLGFTAAAAYRTLPLLVGHLRATLPDVDLVLEEMVSEEQIQALNDKRIDLAMVRPTPALLKENEQIATALLLRERLVLAVPLGSSFASVRQLGIQALDGQALITWSPRGGRYFVDLLNRLFDAARVRPRIVQRVNEAHTMLGLVAAGLGVALLPESVRSIRVTGVAMRPIRLPPSAHPELVLAWRRDNENPCLTRVRDTAFDHARLDGASG